MTEPSSTPAAAPAESAEAGAAPVLLRDERGERFEVDPEHLEGALASGLRLETAEETAADLREAELNSAGSMATSAGLGVASGVTLGGSDLLINELADPETVEELNAIREANPGSNLAGELVGSIAPALLSGGFSESVTGARLGGRGLMAAAARMTPAGATAALGTAAEGALVRGGLSRARSALVGAAVDGAAGNMVAETARAGLTGEPIQAEQILGAGLFGATLGLGATGGLQAVARGASATARGARNLAGRARGYAEDLARRGLGPGTPTRRLAGGIDALVNPRASEEGIGGALRGLSQRVSGVDPDDLALVTASPGRAFDAEGFEATTSRAVRDLDALGSRIDDAAEGLGSVEARQAALRRAVGDADPVAATRAGRAALEDAESRIAQGLESFSGRSRAGRALRELAGEVQAARGALDETPAGALAALDRVIAAADTAATRAGDDGGRGLVQEIRSTLAGVASEPDAFGGGAVLWSSMDGAVQGWSAARDALRLDQRQLLRELTRRGGATSETITRAGESIDAAESVLAAAQSAGVDVAESRAALEQVRATLGEAITHGEVRGAALRGLDAEGGSALQALAARGAGHVAASTGGVLGALLGGAPGYAVGRTLGGAAQQAIEAARRPVSTYQRIARLGAAVQEYGPRVEAGLDQLRKALESGKLAKALTGTGRTSSRVVLALKGSAEERRAEYRTVRDQLRQFATDPERISDQLGESVGPTADVHPELASQVALTATRGVGYLASELPPIDQSGAIWGTDTLEPSQYEIDAFLRRYEAIEDPASIVERAAEGSLMHEHVEAVRTVYPEVYADISARVTGVLGELEQPPAYAVRIQMGTLLGVPADPTLTPSFIDALQSRYSHTGAQYEAQHGGPQTGSVARIGNTLSSQTASETQSLGRRP